MKLPTHVLVKILGGTNVRFSGGGTHRLAGRADLALSASVLPTSKNSIKVPRSIMVTDVSALGVGFLRAEPMMPRSEFILFLPCQGETSIGIRCSVQWCRRDFQGGFKIGADFMSIVEDQPSDPDAAAEIGHSADPHPAV